MTAGRTTPPAGREVECVPAPRAPSLPAVAVVPPHVAAAASGLGGGGGEIRPLPQNTVVPGAGRDKKARSEDGSLSGLRRGRLQGALKRPTPIRAGGGDARNGFGDADAKVGSAPTASRITGLTRAEAGQIGGLVTLERHGQRHFKRIAKDRPAPTNRGMRRFEAVVGTPRGARLAREIRKSLGGEGIEPT